MFISVYLLTVMCYISVPTFVTFLRDIESEYEVREYVRLYLGEGKEPSDFATQFIERRVKMTRQNRVDNTNVPALTTTNHFQEVKVYFYVKIIFYIDVCNFLLANFGFKFLMPFKSVPGQE